MLKNGRSEGRVGSAEDKLRTLVYRSVSKDDSEKGYSPSVHLHAFSKHVLDR